MVINLASFKRLAARETVLLCYVLIIDNAPRTGEVAKKHDKKDRHQSFSDDQRHKLVQLEMPLRCKPLPYHEGGVSVFLSALGLEAVAQIPLT